ncbi:MAG: hypothetical protein KGO00_08895 [Bacteroidetes bacterium]|nr:hypothetical protein [Bacteroidota bacterium]
MKIVHLILFVVFCAFVLRVNAQTSKDTIWSYQLLTKIQSLQQANTGFPPGIFPSTRVYAYNKNNIKNDPNVFYTGLIVRTLKKYQKYCTPFQQGIINQIAKDAMVSTALFKNRQGRDTYNFWRTDTPQIFPNAGWLNTFDKSQSLPDDFDDTVILLWAQEVARERAAAIHDTMQLFANTKGKTVKNTLKAFETLPAYSTWFGKKMPIDFDMAVLCNVLSFVNAYNLKWTSSDTASLQLITTAIQNNWHIGKANFIAPHYAKPAVILYHIARLLDAGKQQNIEALMALKPSLLHSADSLLAKSVDPLETVLLQSARLHFGGTNNVDASNIVTTQTIDPAAIEQSTYPFFIANMASMLPSPLKRPLSKLAFAKFEYRCPAYNLALLWENKHLCVPLHK